MAPRNPPKESWIKRNAIILSLIIASFGGLPGIYTIRGWFNDRAKPKFSISTVVYGDTKINGITYGCFIVSGVISNDGLKSFKPRYFSGSLKYDNVNAELKPLITKDSITANSPSGLNHMTYYYDKNPDLQTVKNISQDSSVYGKLVFITTFDTLNQFKRATNKIISVVCTDISDRVFKFEDYDFNSKYPIDLTSPTINSKEGIKVK